MKHPLRRRAASAAFVLMSLGPGLPAHAAPAKKAAAPAAAAAPAPPPGSHVVKMTNSEKQAVTAVYASTTGKNDWGDDLLGKQTAAPGRTVSLVFVNPAPEACVQDLQLLMNDGKTVQKSALNVCDDAAYEFKQ